MKGKIKNKLKVGVILGSTVVSIIIVFSIIIYAVLFPVPIPQTKFYLDLTEVWNPEEGFVTSIDIFDVNDKLLESVSMVTASQNNFLSEKEYRVNSTIQIYRNYYGGSWELSKIALNYNTTLRTVRETEVFYISNSTFAEGLIAGEHR